MGTGQSLMLPFYQNNMGPGEAYRVEDSSLQPFHFLGLVWYLQGDLDNTGDLEKVTKGD